MKSKMPRTILLSSLCVAIGSSSIAFASRSVQAMRIPTSSVANSFSAKDYYRGIIFKYGPLANRVDTISKHFAAEKFLTTANYAKYVEATEQIMNDLEARDPSIFQRFQSAAQSGDHIRILESLDEAGATLNNYMLEKHPETRPSLGNDEDGKCLVFFIGAAVLIVVAVETASVFHLATEITEYISGLTAAEGDVLKEKMVDDIAMSFAAN